MRRALLLVVAGVLVLALGGAALVGVLVAVVAGAVTSGGAAAVQAAYREASGGSCVPDGAGWSTRHRYDAASLDGVTAFQSSPADNGTLTPGDTGNAALQWPTLESNVEIVSDPAAVDGSAMAVWTRPGAYRTPGGSSRGWTNGRMMLTHPGEEPPVRVRARLRFTPSTGAKAAVMWWPAEDGWPWEVDFAETFDGDVTAGRIHQRWHGDVDGDGQAIEQISHVDRLDATAYHEYELTILPDRMAVRIDDVETFATTDTRFIPTGPGKFSVGKALTGQRSDPREPDAVIVDWVEIADTEPCPTLPGCTTDVDAAEGLTPEQSGNAATIVAVGKQLGVPEQGWVVALATAMQESTLLNLAYGHLDSLGLFQQRNAWGPAADRTDPAKSAGMFYTGGQGGQRGLLDIDGWESMPVTEAAQAVQVSAFPDAYARHEPLARALVAQLGGADCAPPTELGDCPPPQPGTQPAATYNDPRMQANARLVTACVAEAFPQIATIGGWGTRGNVTDHDDGLAVDIMIPASTTDAGRELGDQIAAWLEDHHETLGITYMQWLQRIWASYRIEDGWRPQSDRGSWTANHMDHVHVSVSPAATL